MKIIGYIKSYGLCKEADWEVLRWSAIENTWDRFIGEENERKQFFF